VLVTLAWLLLAGAAYLRCRPRPAHLPLSTVVDGPAPARAAGVLFYLHGYGGGVARAQGLVERLRADGLPADVSIVLLEGPFSTGLGHSWGDTEEEQATSRARVRARLRELLGESGPARARVVIAGFSQGASMAIDLAVEEPRIGGLVSLSPCASWLRGELPKREGLRVLLVHGKHDDTCPVSESRTLAGVLEAAHKPVEYIELEGGHSVPQQAIHALSTFASH